jgi:hypothetical protein
MIAGVSLGVLLASAAPRASGTAQGVLRVGAVVTSSCAVHAPSVAVPALRLRCVDHRAAPIVATIDSRAPVMVEMKKEAPAIVGATIAMPVGQHAPARRLTIQF